MQEHDPANRCDSLETGPEENKGEKATSSEVQTSFPGGRPSSDPRVLKVDRLGSDPRSVHRLIEIDDRMAHVWDIEGEDGAEAPITSIDRRDMTAVISQYARCLLGDEAPTIIQFRPFGQWDDAWQGELSGWDGSSQMTVVRDGETLDLRYRGEGYQYDLRYDQFPRKENMGPYMISRLSNLGFDGVPTLLGVSYWDMGGEILPWSSLIRFPGIPTSGYRPFLSDLQELITGFRKLTPEQALGYLFGLSTSLERGSFDSAFQLGVSIGELQGHMTSRNEKDPMEGKHSFGDRILDRFRMGAFTTSDLGEILGRASSYLDGVKRSLRKTSGNGKVRSPTSGRKLKVLRGQSIISKGMGPEEARLSLLNGYLLRKERSIRSGIKGLRAFVGSPSISSCVDCNLERLSMINADWFMFPDMDWQFHMDEEGPGRKMLPLKDLAQVLNSLLKARYLSARRIFSQFSRTKGIDREIFDTLFLEYNLKKPSYRKMMPDLRIHRRIGEDVPFRVIFDISIISMLWYERCHNALVEGYNKGISMYDNKSLIEYPRGTDTAEGIRIMQALLSLSDLSRSLEGADPSRVSLESDLLILLTRW